ncbi:TPA: hypothetical protein ACQNWS_000388 [Streptococcus pyogenes]|uniref:Uncharacterized protein n=3 Tax=Streptococcus pyogenes TaxID=1314 RepID=A0A5S4TJP0_STRPY|nr:hypothetical protein [Streptococcus pyogenes]ABF36731.1 hypothetical protein MGAS2096_Spy1679 [Streptococcus pyogenes MGAS2096]ESU85219.1 hypothetical protein HMPREF1240_1312 [Streptococcus pyogenes GA03455]KGE54847.1 putative membrane protein [Streptococcus pyogenes AA216]MDV6873066.1 hypothetical protein [Pseudomonas aeruginosa]HEP6153062.1 hypothetical protein [Streptococcus pyogenes ABC020047615]HEP6168735.1 hypothetical protein [Streptococcus pyogenes ABC020047934]HEP6170339.1 hypoth
MNKIRVGLYVIMSLSILVFSITLVASLIFLLRQDMVKAIIYFILTLFWLIGLVINIKLLKRWNSISEKDLGYQDDN